MGTVADGSTLLVVRTAINAKYEHLGTFGSGGSTTGGDLPGTPPEAYLDSYVCDTDGFVSANAALNFNAGDKAYHDGSNWIKIAAVPVKVVREISATTTTTFIDRVISATGTFTVNLHTTVGSSNILVIKCVSGTITIDANGTETIDGSLTKIITAQQSISLVPVVVGWIII